MDKKQFVAMLEQAEAAGEKAIEGMKDGYPCGGAWVTASGNSDFIKLFKKYADKKEGEGANVRYTIGSWHISKGWPSGYSVHYAYGNFACARRRQLSCNRMLCDKPREPQAKLPRRQHRTQVG